MLERGVKQVQEPRPASFLAVQSYVGARTGRTPASWRAQWCASGTALATSCAAWVRWRRQRRQTAAASCGCTCRWAGVGRRR